MTESSVIIPINPEVKDIRALINAKSNYGLTRLAQLPVEQLRTLLREWYEQALATNVITLLQILICQAGKLDLTGHQQTWTQDGIEATFDHPAGSLTITVNGSMVCDTRAVGNEVFVPGDWLKTAFAALDRIELQSRRAAEQSELQQRRDLIGLLGAQV